MLITMETELLNIKNEKLFSTPTGIPSCGINPKKK